MRSRCSPFGRAIALGLGCACIVGIPVKAEDVDPCAEGSRWRTVNFGAFSQAYTSFLSEEKKVAADVLTSALAARATSDGLGSGRLDLLRRFFVALDFGAVSEEEKSLVFNFNPEGLNTSWGQFSPRVVVHEAELYGPVDDEIDGLDAALQESARDALEEELGDLDDVEFALRFVASSQDPRRDLGAAQKLQEAASALYAEARKAAGMKAPAEPLEEWKAQFNQKLAKALKLSGPVINPSIEAICNNDEAKRLLETLAASLQAKVAAANETLTSELESVGFFRLADLIDGQPRWVFNAASRQRTDGAGPDEFRADVTFQWGAVSYGGAERWIKKKDKKNKKEGKPGVEFNADNVLAYLDSHGSLKESLPLLTFVASYTDVKSFEASIPGVPDPFRTETVRKWTGKLTGGCYLDDDRNRRIELTAAYDDVSDDPNLQSRFVSELSWVEKFSEEQAKQIGGTEFVATVVWANKPEFRGEVDEEWGLRAGLKWSLGDGKKD